MMVRKRGKWRQICLCQMELTFPQISRKYTHAQIQMRGGGGRRIRTPLENHKSIGFLSNTCPDPLKNHKAAKPAFIVGHHRLASETPLNGVSLAGRCWPANSGIWILSLLINLKNVKVGPPLTKLSESSKFDRATYVTGFQRLMPSVAYSKQFVFISCTSKFSL